jgi:hypothetical protein
MASATVSTSRLTNEKSAGLMLPKSVLMFWGTAIIAKQQTKKNNKPLITRLPVLFE